MKELEYLKANSNQTLLEAIKELRVAEGADNDAAEYISPELLDDIELHDVIHTVFACPTSLKGEILAHIWSVFGTSLSMKEMHRVSSHADHKKVLREIGHIKLLKTWFKNIPNILRIVFRSKKMHKKWLAHEFEHYLEMTLHEIRAEYGIQVIEASSSKPTSGGAALRSVHSNS